MIKSIKKDVGTLLHSAGRCLRAAGKLRSRKEESYEQEVPAAVERTPTGILHRPETYVPTGAMAESQPVVTRDYQMHC